MTDVKNKQAVLRAGTACYMDEIRNPVDLSAAEFYKLENPEVPAKFFKRGKYLQGLRFYEECSFFVHFP